ncbi:MAG: glycoside hydrolase family 76 protein [Solirubrobacteraceae bacterium]
MLSDLTHRREPVRRSLLCTLLTLAPAAALALCLAAPAPAAATSPANVHRRSAYPAAASGPSRRVSELAHARQASSSGGAAAPGSSKTTGATPTSARKSKKPKPKKPALHGNALRALLAFEAMQKYYYIPGSDLYAGEPFSYLWPFSQALAATVSVAYIPNSSASLAGVSLAKELHARLEGLNSYLDTNNSGAPEGLYMSALPAFDGTAAPPVGPGGTKYYDDNDWVAIELVRLYQLTHASALLGSAEGIMAFEMAGWEERPGLACEGGIPFSNADTNGERNTTTTAPAAELGTLLYKLTSNVAYLRFAEKAYEWVRTCLQEPVNLYADHIGNKGVVEPKLWSYNQGSMIGAGTLLYQATGNSGYLYQARQSAKAALGYFSPEKLGSESPFFVSVYFRNLLYLDSVTHDPPGPAIAQAYVNYAWEHLRGAHDIFVAGSPASAQLLYQAAIVQIYALLSIPPASYF